MLTNLPDSDTIDLTDRTEVFMLLNCCMVCLVYCICLGSGLEYGTAIQEQLHAASKVLPVCSVGHSCFCQ